jgi:hypothetical protein
MKLVLVGVGRSLRNVVGGKETISIRPQTFSPKIQLILQILFSPRMAFDSLESSDSWLLLFVKFELSMNFSVTKTYHTTPKTFTNACQRFSYALS